MMNKRGLQFHFSRSPLFLLEVKYKRNIVKVSIAEAWIFVGTNYIGKGP